MTPAKPQRSVFFVSDHTGITAELLGEMLLAQFPNVEFRKRTLPFVEAKSALAQINDTAQKEKSTADRWRKSQSRFCTERACSNA